MKIGARRTERCTRREREMELQRPFSCAPSTVGRVHAERAQNKWVYQEVKRCLNLSEQRDKILGRARDAELPTHARHPGTPANVKGQQRDTRTMCKEKN